MTPGISDLKKPVDEMENELRSSYKNVMKYDNRPAIDVARTAAEKSGVNPSLLFSSAFQEGMNKSILIPDEVSEAFVNAEQKGLDTKTYPVDGFYNYGLDTFGTQYDRLKKYLPEGFDKRFKTYKALNEHNKPVNTAAFMTNEDALTAKGAMMRDLNDQVDYYAKKNGIKIRPEDKDYFTLAAYNGGFGRAKTILNEYKNAKDQKAFIENGGTSLKGIHKNISPRLSKMKIVDDLLKQYSAEQQPAQ